MKLRKQANVQSVTEDIAVLTPLLQPFSGRAWDDETIAQVTDVIADNILSNPAKIQRQAIFNYLKSRLGRVINYQGLLKNAWRIAGNKHLLKLSPNSLLELDNEFVKLARMQIKILKVENKDEVLHPNGQLRYGRPVLRARVYTGPLAGSDVDIVLPGMGSNSGIYTMRVIGMTKRILDYVHSGDVIGTFLCCTATVVQDGPNSIWSPMRGSAQQSRIPLLRINQMSVTSFMKQYNRALWRSRLQYKDCMVSEYERPVCVTCGLNCPLAGVTRKVNEEEQK